MDRYLHSRRIDRPETDETCREHLTQEMLLERILAAISVNRPDKCVVLEARHVPTATPGYASLSS